MYLNIPFLDNAISHRKNPADLFYVVDKYLDHLDVISLHEDQLTGLVQTFAKKFQLSYGTVGSNTTFRRCLLKITEGYRALRKKIDSFTVPEDSMDASTHEEYLQVLVAVELLAHLILSQYQIKFGTRSCSDCDTFYIDPPQAPTSLWACKGVRRINIPDSDGEISFKFGKYNAAKRDFD